MEGRFAIALDTQSSWVETFINLKRNKNAQINRLVQVCLPCSDSYILRSIKAKQSTHSGA